MGVELRLVDRAQTDHWLSASRMFQLPWMSPEGPAREAGGLCVGGDQHHAIKVIGLQQSRQIVDDATQCCLAAESSTSMGFTRMGLFNQARLCHERTPSFKSLAA